MPKSGNRFSDKIMRPGIPWNTSEEETMPQREHEQPKPPPQPIPPQPEQPEEDDDDGDDDQSRDNARSN